MNCEAAREFGMQELDGALPPADAAELARHVAACAACREHVLAARRLELALRATAAPEFDDDELDDAVRAVVRRAQGRRLAPMLAWTAALAALVLAFVWFVRRMPAEPAVAPVAGAQPSPSAESTHAEPERVAQETPNDLARVQSAERSGVDVAAPSGMAASLGVDAELSLERTRLRRALEAAAFVAGATPIEAERFAIEVESSGEFVRAGTDAGLRQIEAFLREGPPELAARAARYLGVRADRRSLAPLARSNAPRDELALACLDLARRAPEALVRALDVVESRDLVLSRAADAGLAPRAWVDALVAVGETNAARWSAVLARLGPAEFAQCVADGLPLDVLGDVLADPANEALARRADVGSTLASAAVRAKGERVDQWLAFCERVPVPEAASWLVDALGERRSRAAALAALAKLEGTAGLQELFDEVAQSRAKRADLVAVLRERATREPEALRTFTDAVLAREDDATELLLDALIETETVGASSALVAFAVHRGLPTEWRTSALDALCERASLVASAELSGRVATFTRRERRLAALALLTIARHGAEQDLDAALDGFDAEQSATIRSIVSRGTPRSSQVVQLARLLEARLPEQPVQRLDLRFTP